jgi:hypothetical protein
MDFFEGYEREGDQLLSGKRVGGTPFFGHEKENKDILGIFWHFVEQKVPIYSKIAQNGSFESLKSVFSYFIQFTRFDFIIFLPILVDFLRVK